MRPAWTPAPETSIRTCCPENHQMTSRTPSSTCLMVLWTTDRVRTTDSSAVSLQNRNVETYPDSRSCLFLLHARVSSPTAEGDGQKEGGGQMGDRSRDGGSRRAEEQRRSHRRFTHLLIRKNSFPPAGQCCTSVALPSFPVLDSSACDSPPLLGNASPFQPISSPQA